MYHIIPTRKNCFWVRISGIRMLHARQSDDDGRSKCLGLLIVASIAHMAGSGLSESSQHGAGEFAPVSKPDMPHWRATRFSFRFQNSSITEFSPVKHAWGHTGGGRRRARGKTKNDVFHVSVVSTYRTSGMCSILLRVKASSVGRDPEALRSNKGSQ